jgi:hypothetical protein
MLLLRTKIELSGRCHKTVLVDPNPSIPRLAPRNVEARNRHQQNDAKKDDVNLNEKMTLLRKFLPEGEVVLALNQQSLKCRQSI